MNSISNSGQAAKGSLSLTCAVCGGAVDKELLRITQPDRFECALGITAEGYQRAWRECEDCGAVTNVQDASVAQSLAGIAESYYEIDFGAKSLAERFAKIMALPAGLSDNDGRVRRIHRMVDDWFRPDGPCGKAKTSTKAERQVLDIGAGLGVFLTRFLTAGWQGVAVEPDANACAHLRLIAGKRFEVVQGLFTGQPQFRGYDLITLNKVVEHLAEPVSLLRSVHPALGRGGLLYVEVPDKLTIFHRPASDNILGSLHHHLYDPRSLATLFEVAGFLPVKVGRAFEPSGKITTFGFAVASASIDQIANPSSL